MLGRQRLDEVQRADIQAIVDLMTPEWSGSRVRTVVNAIHSLYAWAQDRELANHDPAARVRLPAMNAKPRDRVATVQEMEALLGALDPADALPYALAVYATARRAEIRHEQGLKNKVHKSDRQTCYSGATMRTDVHQHLWSEPLVEQLASRRELPFVRLERGLTVLYLAGERPYVIDRVGEDPARRAALVERDGLDRALLCLSSPIGIERLCRDQAEPLLDAYHEGALSIQEPFGVWGAIALDRPDPADVDRAIDRGCLGISLPAGALAGVDELLRMRPLLDRLESRGAPLFVHPGPGIGGSLPGRVGAEGSLAEPLWWPAMTDYVAGMQAAWLAFQAVGRPDHPRLRVIFSMLAGLAPLQAERLSARGGPGHLAPDPLLFYETSSYGPQATSAIEAIVGARQILYGSDRPVLEPSRAAAGSALDWDVIDEVTVRALGVPTGVAAL